MLGQFRNKIYGTCHNINCKIIISITKIIMTTGFHNKSDDFDFHKINNISSPRHAGYIT